MQTALRAPAIPPPYVSPFAPLPYLPPMCLPCPPCHTSPLPIFLVQGGLLAAALPALPCPRLYFGGRRGYPWA